MTDEPATPPVVAAFPQDAIASQLVRIETRRRMLKQRYDQLRSEHDAVKKELAQYKDRPKDPTVEQLRGELLEIKHRKVFDNLAMEAKARSTALDDIWRLSGYAIDPHSDVINEDALRKVIAEQLKSRPYLFEANGEVVVPKPAEESNLEPGPGNSRGGLVREAGKFRITRRELKNLTPARQAQLADEYKKDNVEIID